MSEFKVGDWVTRSLDDCEIHTGIKVAQIHSAIGFSGYAARYTIKLPSGCFVDYLEEHLKLWKPKVGEWCIYNFDLGDTTIPIFILPQLDSFGHLYAKNPINHEVISIMFDDDDWLCDCEPFIGELPSSIKETK